MTVQALDSVKKRIVGNGDRRPTHQRMAKFVSTTVVPASCAGLGAVLPILSGLSEPDRQVSRGIPVCTAYPDGPCGRIVFH